MPTVINEQEKKIIQYFCDLLCPSLLSPRALFLHAEEQWDAERRSLLHFALCLFLPLPSILQG